MLYVSATLTVSVRNQSYAYGSHGFHMNFVVTNLAFVMMMSNVVLYNLGYFSLNSRMVWGSSLMDRIRRQHHSKE